MSLLSLRIVSMAFFAAAAVDAQSLDGCPMFPANNIWNVRVNNLPVHANSASYVARIGSSSNVHPDFGAGLWNGGPIGIPYITVAGTQSKVPITFTYQPESDPGPYPIPPAAPIEGGPQSGGDRHVVVVDRTNCLLYEVFGAYPQADGSWRAGSGALFDLRSNNLRPVPWTSADAAGLPILAGLARYDEVASGAIRHALRFTAPQTRRAYVWPARHFASSITDPAYPAMGQRFRLKSNFDISSYSPQAKVILQALKDYGMILADNGSSWYISGVPDERWNNNQLRELRQVTGSNFEAVDQSSLMVNPDSGQSHALSPVSATPASGTGMNRTFTFMFSNPNGWQDLNIVNILIANGLDARQSCYLAYSRPLNVLYLVDDSGTGLSPALTLGGAGSAANTQCSASAAGSSAAGSGAALSLTLNLTFSPSFAGGKVMYMAAGNSSGGSSGWQALGIWTVNGAAVTSPAVGGASPARGSGLSQTFTFSAADNLGWQNLNVVNILVNSSIDARQSCYIAYSRPIDILYLVDDSGLSLLPGFTPGGPGSAANSQCAITGAGSSVSGSGNTLTLTLNIRFTPAFAGNRIVYMAAGDAAGRNSGWQAPATWTVP